MNFDKISIEPSSYKDADGYVFYKNNKVYRSISNEYLSKYNILKEKEFYKKAINSGFLFPFQELKSDEKMLLECKKIKFISYPPEWTFNELKDAAIFHLNFLSFCLELGVMIKDASPYNIQKVNGKLQFIDLLSFQPIKDNFAWNAYHQFCKMFLAPLLLTNYLKYNRNKSLINNIEGIPLKLVAKELPVKSYFNSLALIHIHGQSKYSKKKVKPTYDAPIITLSKTNNIIGHLRNGIEGLTLKLDPGNWLDYKNNIPYSRTELKLKTDFIQSVFNSNTYKTGLDIGANHELFSNEVYPRSLDLILLENDFATVENLYQLTSKKTTVLNIDITAPTPSFGLNLTERLSFLRRVSPDIILALALIHHLFHSRNIPMHKLAGIFTDYRCDLIIEYIDSKDEKHQLISNPENKHPYNQTLFESCFNEHYTLIKKLEVKKGKRSIYYYKFKN